MTAARYTPEEQAELDRLTAEHAALARAGGRTTGRVVDEIEAVSHGFRRSWLGPRPDDHPRASLHASAGPMPVSVLAQKLRAARGLPDPGPGGDGYAAVMASLSTADFPELLLSTARGIAEALGTDALAGVLAATRDLVVPNFASSTYSVVDLEGLPPPGPATGADFWYPKARMTAERFSAYPLAAKLLVTREALVGDTRGLLTALVQGFAAQAARNEAAVLASLLDDNADLADGDPWFTGDNAISAPMDATGLAAMVSALRTYATPGGGKLGARLAVVVVPPAKELAALGLVLNNFPATAAPQVVVLPDLAGSYWWGIGGSSPIGRVRLEGSTESGIAFSALSPAVEFDRRTNQTRARNGLHIDVTHTVGLFPLGRAGIVRAALS